MENSTVLHRPAVLIIGKDGNRRRQLASRFHRAGCDVLTAVDGREGIQRALDAIPDVVMMEFDLPDADSFEVCRTIRNRLEPRQPPVFLLAGSENSDPVGVDSQATPGGSIDAAYRHDLDAGIGALLTWTQTMEATNDRIERGLLQIDRRRHIASLEGVDLGLTPTEFRLLWTLANEPGHVFERRKLAAICNCGGASGQARAIDVHIKAIRGKLGEHAQLIETVHGIGYRFQDN